LLDHRASDEWSNDISYIHDVGHITIDKSDIFMPFSDDDGLKYGAKDALKNITQSYQSDDDSHIVDEVSPQETHKRSENSDQN
jgi:hypothetical protein